MITILYPYRNRELSRIKRSLDSLAQQKQQNFSVVFLDYGSEENITYEIKQLVDQYSFTSYEYLYTSEQPWSKSKALNYGIKNLSCEYCFTADVDMIFHPQFTEILEKKLNSSKVIYFKIGFLTREESVKLIDFEEYKVSFLTNEEATGMTLFPVEKLKLINGFDEFFHFWGAEDTDIHNRLSNLGCKVEFFDEKILLLHQWHLNYRKKETIKLNKELQLKGIVELNHKHLKYNFENRITKVNSKGWGCVMTKTDYETLLNLPLREMSNEVSVINHFLYVVLNDGNTPAISVRIIKSPVEKTLKHKIKKLLGKKVSEFYSIKEISDKMLLHIVAYQHHLPYTYSINEDFSSIDFKMIRK
jgi:glycosyltransferase involved in cell wall biosynthesis